MPTTKLVPEGDDVLWEACPPWDFSNPPEDPLTVSQTMHLVMHTERGVGLSANQIGHLYRVFVMNDPDTNMSWTCFNPEIIGVSEELATMEEGCLSFPGLILEIKRPSEVDVRYQTVTGEWKEEHLTGLMARCYQHELDHLDGVCFISPDRVSKLRLDRAYRKRSKASKGK